MTVVACHHGAGNYIGSECDEEQRILCGEFLVNQGAGCVVGCIVAKNSLPQGHNLTAMSPIGIGNDVDCIHHEEVA